LISGKRLYISGLAAIRRVKHVSPALLVLVILLSFPSCIKEEFNAEDLSTSLQINPGIAVPIGWARYQMDEFLNDSSGAVPDELIIDENGFMSLIYKQDLFSVRADSIISLPNQSPAVQSIDSPFDVQVDLGLLDSAKEFQDTVTINLSLEGLTDAVIDSILLSYGQLTLSVSAPSYPEMIWSTRILIEGIPGWQATLDDIDNSVTDTLDGVTLPLYNTDDDQNALRFYLIITLWDTLAVINPGPILDLSISLVDLDYSAIYGYLGNFEMQVGPETTDLDFFDEMAGGAFEFADPLLNIDILNSFGLPIDLDLTDFFATESGGAVHFITQEPGDTPFMIEVGHPETAEDDPVPTSYSINRENSNLEEVVTYPLATFTAGATGTANPEGPPNENFILDTSSLSVSSELVLPLEGQTDTIIIRDTLPFIFRDYFDNPPEEIERLIFSATYVTQFPVDVITQVEFLDQGENHLDYIFDDEDRIIIDGAEVGPDGIAIISDPYTVPVELTREQIENMIDCHYIVVIGEVITRGDVDVRFYSYYFFDTDIGVIAELKLNSGSN
jgi:hypothetical protein